MNENKKPIKKRRRKLKLGYVFAAIIILVVLIFGIKMILPSGSSKYGDRLDGIKKISFKKEDQDKIVKKVKESDKVISASIDVQGKIINIIFKINKDASLDDAKNIANSSLEVISDDVKNFYDIQFMVSKKDEEVPEGGKAVFPKMGYKNSKSKGIVW